MLNVPLRLRNQWQASQPDVLRADAVTALLNMLCYEGSIPLRCAACADAASGCCDRCSELHREALGLQVVVRADWKSAGPACMVPHDAACAIGDGDLLHLKVGVIVERCGGCLHGMLWCRSHRPLIRHCEEQRPHAVALPHPCRAAEPVCECPPRRKRQRHCTAIKGNLCNMLKRNHKPTVICCRPAPPTCRSTLVVTCRTKLPLVPQTPFGTATLAPEFATTTQPCMQTPISRHARHGPGQPPTSSLHACMRHLPLGESAITRSCGTGQSMPATWQTMTRRGWVGGGRLAGAIVHGKKNQIGHHARPRRASATVTAPLRTGADTCKTGSGAGKRSKAKSDPACRRSNHAWTEDHAGGQKRANIDAVGGWRVHTADDRPSRNAATGPKHLSAENGIEDGIEDGIVAAQICARGGSGRCGGGGWAGLQARVHPPVCVTRAPAVRCHSIASWKGRASRSP